MSELRCPICGIAWPEQIACCPCGFAPAAIEQFEVQLKLRRKRGFAVQIGGAALLGLAALAWLAISRVEGAIVMGVLSTSACVIGGIAMVARGTLMVGQSTRRLIAVREMRKLPVAKIRALGPGR